jgi:hypothetical protein
VVALALCAGAAAFPAGGAVAAEPEMGSIGIQLVDAPTSRRSDPRAQKYIVDHVAPGTVIQRRVKVRNSTGHRQRIDVYAGPATVEAGQFRFASADESSELTSWTSLDRPTLRLAAGEDDLAEVTIKIPEEASRGERYGVIWASMKATADSPSNAITQVRRVGVRIYLDIGRGGEPASAFEIGESIATRAADGQPSLHVGVRNTGGRALDLIGNLRLADGPGGLRAGPFEVVQGTTLAPGDEGQVAVLLPKSVPNGPWVARLTLRSGLVQQTKTIAVTFPDPAAAPTKDSNGIFTRTTMVIGGLVLLLSLALLGLVARARRSRHTDDALDDLLGDRRTDPV